ncbi:DNA polymerase III, clamp loader complex, gamma/delta/delta subunit [Pisolithus croceorrhizus]|nr:DNA polymerase III, clamp loader complex, gamma/delta/delta subunit [Pisolithus croceorrhizus]
MKKYTMLTPFDATSKMFASREALNDKMELYFDDHALCRSYRCENYLKIQPAGIRDSEDPLKALEHLWLMDKASLSISDSDLVDILIHGCPEQHWSLIPPHAVCSTIRPSSFVYESGWDMNSKGHQLSDIQARMRLKISGDEVEIGQSYVPVIFLHLVNPLSQMDRWDAADDVIEWMNEYDLTREGWDTIVELGGR